MGTDHKDKEGYMSQGEKIAIIISDASYERVEYVLALAFSSAAMGKEVHILFTYGAVTRLKKGHTDRVGEETSEWIREQVKTGLEKGSMQRISELIKNLKRLGAKIYACVAAMAFHNITRDELIEEVDEVQGLVAFIESIAGASTVIFV